VDEGNNWVNLRWGPLSMTNPAVVAGPNGNYGGGLLLGNYAITGPVTAGPTQGSAGTNYADAPAYDFFNKPRKPGPVDAGAVQFRGGGVVGGEFTLSPPVVDFGLIPVHFTTILGQLTTTLDQDILFTNSDVVPLTFGSASLSCTGVTPAASCNLASFATPPPAPPTSLGPDPVGACAGGTVVAAGQSCVITVTFVPDRSSTTPGIKNANLLVTAGGLTQTVFLTGHDTIATLGISPLTPALNAGAPAATAKTGTITITNTIIACIDPTAPTLGPAGCNANAGPWIPTGIAITQLAPTPTAGNPNFTLGGTCAVGTPLAPQTSCTITITYTPTVGAVSPYTGSVRLQVQNGFGDGTATTVPTNFRINTVYNAN
jgi:hypothetical protein